MPFTLPDLLRRRTQLEKEVQNGLKFLDAVHNGRAATLDTMIASRQPYVLDRTKIPANKQTIINLAHRVCSNKSVKKSVKYVIKPAFNIRSTPTDDMRQAVNIIDIYTNSNTYTSKNDLQPVLNGLTQDYRDTILNLTYGADVNQSGSEELDGLRTVYAALVRIIQCVQNSLP